MNEIDVIPSPIAPIATVQPPAPAPVVAVNVPSSRTLKINCDFCRCQLAPDGGVMTMSDEARTYRDQAETIARLKATIADHERASGEKDRSITELQAQLNARQKGWLRQPVK